MKSNVEPRLVWWVGFVSSFPKVILNQWNCWGGSVLCHVFGGDFFEHVFFSFVLIFWICQSLFDLFEQIEYSFKISKCMVSHNILAKTQLHNSTQTYYQGVPVFLKWKCSNIRFSILSYSFCNFCILLSSTYPGSLSWISMVLL